MKLLFDENLSPQLVRLLNDLFPDSVHVRDVGLETADDAVVWKYAPSISLSGPTEPPLAGDALVYTATFVGKPRYTWRVSTGTILAGQGTSKIAVDTTGLAGQKLTVTVEADDRRGSITGTTCETSIAKRPDH